MGAGGFRLLSVNRRAWPAAHMSDVDKVPLKYEGLDVWEIWVSESQERMTVAIRPESLDRFMELSRKHEVESTVIGSYENTGKLRLSYGGKTCAYLDLSLFSEDFPQWNFDAEWLAPHFARTDGTGCWPNPPITVSLLHALLATPNLSSREWIQRQYDHEVQGGSAIKFMAGRDRDVPNDAAVIRPVLGSRYRSRGRAGPCAHLLRNRYLPHGGGDNR